MRLFHIIICFLLVFFSLLNRLYCTDSLPEADTSEDSANLIFETEYTLYQIQRLKIENKLLNLHKNDLDAEFKTQISALLDEAQKYANQKAYDIANLLLLEIEDFFEEFVPGASPPVIREEEKTELTIKSQCWQAELIGGLDFWNQKFEMNIANNDTTLLEGSTNPFFGIRLALTPNNHFVSNLLIKSSRDYQSVANEFVLSQKLRSIFTFELKNFTDWTQYRDENGLSYWHNRLLSKIQYKPTSRFRFYLSDEFQIRKYRDEQPYYANYYQNQVRLFLDSYPTNNLQFNTGTRWYQRIHPHYIAQDYHKWGWDVTGYINLISKIQLRFNSDLIYKSFVNSAPDTVYHANYLQNYMQFNMKYYFLNPFHLEMNLFSSLVKYEASQSYLRDYLEIETEISINYAFNLSNLIKIGYLYDQNVHQEHASEADIPANTEDFFSHGFILTLDYYLGSRFMLNITDTFRFRTYPHAQELQYFSLYSDRTIHSLLFILSWELTPQYQLSLIANFDDDRDRKHENADSQNTMFSVEFIRKL